MPRRKSSVVSSSTASLPPCPGPQLRPFQPEGASIKWGPRLDTDRPETGSQGFVFQAEIASRQYAIKVFKFYHPLSNKFYWETYLGKSYPLRKALFYTDPFYAECRAYGRIQEARDKRNVKTNIATRCHGYLFLRTEDTNYLRKEEKLDFGTNLIDKKLKRALGGNLQVRAIVKDLETGKAGVQKHKIEHAWRNVSLLNSLGIYSRDIRADNFMSCRIVDFGSSWTEPHAILDNADGEEASEQRLSDRAQFEEMAELEGIRTTSKIALPRYNLRLRKKRFWEPA